VNASAVGFYGDRGEDALTENAARGAGFTGALVSAWEQAAQQATRAGVRVALVRFGLVLGDDGGHGERAQGIDLVDTTRLPREDIRVAGQSGIRTGFTPPSSNCGTMARGSGFSACRLSTTRLRKTAATARKAPMPAMIAAAT